MTDIDRPGAGRPSDPAATLPLPAAAGVSLPSAPTASATDGPEVDQLAAAVLARITGKLGGQRETAAEMPPVDQAIALREQAPELYDLWLKIAQEKAATASYIERAPYEIPERLAQSGRPRALGALIVVLSFCGYLAWLGGPGPYIGGLIAILDLGAMFGMFFGLRPERLAESGELGSRRLAVPARRRIRAQANPAGRERTTSASWRLSSELKDPVATGPTRAAARYPGTGCPSGITTCDSETRLVRF
ncbi:MAG TPA: hypothetical protein VMK13_07445 [Streptosporangiaceae bacterium]|nr:hypothetical protein [Streptosporangiaceae bacterium]